MNIIINIWFKVAHWKVLESGEWKDDGKLWGYCTKIPATREYKPLKEEVKIAVYITGCKIIVQLSHNLPLSVKSGEIFI